MCRKILVIYSSLQGVYNVGHVRSRFVLPTEKRIFVIELIFKNNSGFELLSWLLYMQFGVIYVRRLQVGIPCSNSQMISGPGNMGIQKQ